MRQLLIKVEKNERPFAQGMLARMVLSYVVDADRWDTVCFKKGESPFREDLRADWATIYTPTIKSAKNSQIVKYDEKTKTPQTLILS